MAERGSVGRASISDQLKAGKAAAEQAKAERPPKEKPIRLRGMVPASFLLRASMARGQRSALRLGFSFGGRSAFACSAAAFPALSWSLMNARPTEPRSAICSSFAS